MKNQKTAIWKKIAKDFVKDAWIVFIGIASVASVVGIFWQVQSHKIIWILTVIILFLLITFIRIINKLITNKIDEETLDIPTEIQKLVKYLYDNKNYNDVVRFGTTISRFLWLNNFNSQRLAIGKMVEDSASKTRNVKAQVSALIDDIGWTYHITGNSDKAKTNINNGINKAETNQLYYFAAKGERHLAGIEAENGNRQNILQHFTNAQQYAQKITEIPQKNEINGSLFLAKAEYFYEDKDYLQAETNLLEARSLFENDSDRIVKTHSLLGNIYLAQNTENSIQKAKDEFNDGYRNCKNIRKNEYARNAVGLAKIEMNECNMANAKQYLEDAKTIFIGGNKTKELKEVNNLLTQINNGI
jgi:hypothetical protein